MAKCYFELRKQSAKGTDSIAADMMRHLHTRQHLGKVVVLCSQPTPLLAASRKQWLKLARTIQNQRASTLNADKILKYTHTITHMQHMRFTAKNPLEEPDANVYFLSEDTCSTMPLHCYTLYNGLELNEPVIASIAAQLPADALIVDYVHNASWTTAGMQAKATLEQHVDVKWQHVSHFLKSNGITINELIQNGMHNIDAMDNALDTLLGMSHRFLRIANDFQRALELARPLRISRALRQEYDSLVLLAYRVQALSPGTYTQRFLESYNEDDTFFLYDVGKRKFIASGEPLGDAVARHMAAGRVHLSRALRDALSQR